MPRYQRRPEDIIGDQRDPPKRPAICDKRVWASVRQDAKTIIASAFAEAFGRDPQQEQNWVVLVDGEPHQLKTIKTMAQKQGVEVTIVLDFIHVLEYLWKAAYCFCPSGSETAEVWVRSRALRILQGQASDVAAGIRRSATLQQLSPKARENADRTADYEYWQFHKMQEFQRNHVNKFQNPERLLDI